MVDLVVMGVGAVLAGGLGAWAGAPVDAGACAWLMLAAPVPWDHRLPAIPASLATDEGEPSILRILLLEATTPLLLVFVGAVLMMGAWWGLDRAGLTGSALVRVLFEHGIWVAMAAAYGGVRLGVLRGIADEPGPAGPARAVALSQPAFLLAGTGWLMLRFEPAAHPAGAGGLLLLAAGALWWSRRSASTGAGPDGRA